VKIGDLVKRKQHPLSQGVSLAQLDPFQVVQVDLEVGIILSLQMAGKPKHPCATVFYSGNQTYNIALSLIEVINEGR
jgi:hypothetical protein